MCGKREMCSFYTSASLPGHVIIKAAQVDWWDGRQANNVTFGYGMGLNLGRVSKS
jgi:hypothetical protein